MGLNLNTAGLPPDYLDRVAAVEQVKKSEAHQTTTDREVYREESGESQGCRCAHVQDDQRKSQSQA